MTPKPLPYLCDDHRRVLGNFRRLRGRGSHEYAHVRREYARQCRDCQALNQEGPK